jgi:putative Mg2+ transporter-C (MgtC) family protein
VTPSDLELAGRIGLAVLLSGMIGLEREVTDKTAGLRTHISVALGACLFGIISAYSFHAFGKVPRNDSSYQVDVSRVASTVVTGIGFLGAGAIVKQGATVRGLTTAGSMWVAAAIGLGCGLGVYFASVVTTAAMLGALVVLRAPDRWIQRRFTRRHQKVVVTLAPGADAADVITALHRLEGVAVHSLSLRDLEDRRVVQADVEARAGADVESLLGDLADRDDVSDVDLG